jgi:hypothetical protein
MQQVKFGMRSLGPAVAALMVASVGPTSCYVLDLVSFVAPPALLPLSDFRQVKWNERVIFDSSDYIEIHRIKDVASIGALVA